MLANTTRALINVPILITILLIAQILIAGTLPVAADDGAADTLAAPAAPSDLKAVKIHDKDVIRITWTDNSDNEEGFYIYTDISPDFNSAGMLTITLDPDTTNYLDTVYPGDTFYYKLTAFNEAGESEATDIASVNIPLGDVTPPSPPSNLSAKLLIDNKVKLSWKDNSDDEVGFLLERALDSQFAQSPAAYNLAANSVSFTDDTVLMGQTYYYRVTAFNAVGSSHSSNVITAITPEIEVPLPVPNAPSDLQAIKVNYTQVDLTWTDNSDNEEGFRIETATNEAFQNVLVINVDANSSQYSDLSVYAGETFYYRVMAFNSSGDSEPSNSVSIVIDLEENDKESENENDENAGSESGGHSREGRNDNSAENEDDIGDKNSETITEPTPSIEDIIDPAEQLNPVVIPDQHQPAEISEDFSNTPPESTNAVIQASSNPAPDPVAVSETKATNEMPLDSKAQIQPYNMIFLAIIIVTAGITVFLVFYLRNRRVR